MIKRIVVWFYVFLFEFGVVSSPRCNACIPYTTGGIGYPRRGLCCCSGICGLLVALIGGHGLQGS